jgi:hypothetical protein
MAFFNSLLEVDTKPLIFASGMAGSGGLQKGSFEAATGRKQT